MPYYARAVRLDALRNAVYARLKRERKAKRQQESESSSRSNFCELRAWSLLAKRSIRQWLAAKLPGSLNFPH